MNFLDLSKFKACSCGTHVDSEECHVKDEYTWIGWFFWSMGTTAIPKRTTFHCTKCDIQFEDITDRELIKYYMLYRRK